jgi:hypothetical protein
MISFNEIRDDPFYLKKDIMVIAKTLQKTLVTTIKEKRKLSIVR